MSQSRASGRETQAIVQSMLQRLRLQADTETQGGVLPVSPTTAACQPHQQTIGLNGNPAQNGLGTARDYDLTKEGLREGHGQEVRRLESGEIPLDSNLDNSVTGAKVNGEHGFVTDSGQEMQSNSPKTFSSTSCKNNTGYSDESGGTVQTVTSFVVGGRLFPVSPENDADDTSSARRYDNMEAEKKGNGNSVIEGTAIHDVMSAVRDNVHSSLADDSASQYHSPSPSSDPGMTAESGTLTQTLSVNGDRSTPPVQGFSTRVYAWSLKGPSTVSGDPGPLAQSQDPEIGSKIPDSTSPPLQRNRASGGRTKRWTQKIKEKFKERGGSLKKRKEAEKEDAKSEDDGKAPTQNECRTTEDASSVTSETDQTAVTTFTNPEPSPVETRSSNDFDLGLGSFSLLEEIKTGQYWANFLSPALPDVSTPAHQHAGQSNTSASTGLRGDNQSSGSIHQRDYPGVAMATADLPVPVTMDISEPHCSLVPMVTGRDPGAEPMEQHSQSDVVSEPRGPLPPAADQVQLAGVVHNTILRSQIHRNRKRSHHRVLERTSRVGMSEIDRKGASPDEPSSSSGLVNGTAGVAEDNSRLFLYPLKIHPKPSSPAPCEFVPKGILKQTHSSDSEGSVPMETAAKKRRMEVRRQVCFAEEVVCIPPAVPDISMDTDSEEEESGSEKNSEEEKEEEKENATAQGSGVETAEPGGAPPRPPTLPGWIRALRRRTGRKPKL